MPDALSMLQMFFLKEVPKDVKTKEEKRATITLKVQWVPFDFDPEEKGASNADSAKQSAKQPQAQQQGRQPQAQQQRQQPQAQQRGSQVPAQQQGKHTPAQQPVK